MKYDIRYTIFWCLFLLVFIFIGGLYFKFKNNRDSWSRGFIDLISWLFSKKKCSDFNQNLILSVVEVEFWIDMLDSVLIQPYLIDFNIMYDDGIMTIQVGFIDFSYLLREKNKREKQNSITQNLYVFYRRQHDIRVDSTKWLFKSFCHNYFELWIPINVNGQQLIDTIKADRRKL